jgi:hypothetical protein
VSLVKLISLIHTCSNAIVPRVKTLKTHTSNGVTGYTSFRQIKNQKTQQQHISTSHIDNRHFLYLYSIYLLVYIYIYTIMPFQSVFTYFIITGAFMTSCGLIGSLNWLLEGKRQRSICLDSFSHRLEARDRMIHQVWGKKNK